MTAQSLSRHKVPQPIEDHPFDYSDGDALESRMLTQLHGCHDVSCASEELQQFITDWPSEYHLSTVRHNLLRPFQFAPGDRILELGCGCGALTRYLGETGAQVIGVEGSDRRAAIARERCRDLSNVSIHCQNLMDYCAEQHFDYVLLIGVLEYAPKYIVDAHDSVRACLEHAESLLADDGTLILAIENQLGLKYFNGCNEDHIGTPYYGIHGLYGSSDPTTFGRQTLVKLLTGAGFARQDFFFPFPDYKLPQILISEIALKQPGFHVADLLCRTVASNRQSGFNPAFYENLAWQTIEQNGLLGDLANSFLVLAGKNGNRKAPTWLAYAYASERRLPFATETRFTVEDNLIVVSKRPLATNCKAPSQPLLQGELQQSLSKKAVYVFGEIYLTELQRLLGRGGGLDDLDKWAGHWIDILLSETRYENGMAVLDGAYLDAIPANLVRTKDGTLVLIDQEWKVTSPVPLAWVLVRGLLNSIAASPASPQLANLSFRQVITHVMDQVAHRTSLQADEAFSVANRYENALRKVVFGERFSLDLINNALEQPAISLLNGITQRDNIHLLQEEITRIKSTFSWQLTKPIRLLANLPRFMKRLLVRRKDAYHHVR